MIDPEFKNLVDAFSTREGLMEIAYSCWILLNNRERGVVAAGMEDGDNGSECDLSDFASTIS